MTRFGFKFNGNDEMANGSFEVFETNLLIKIFPKVDYVVNIGANIGYYVCHALKNKKKVFAFEPLEGNLRQLLRNIKYNNWEDNCEVFPLALSNKISIIDMYGGGTGASLIKGWAGTSLSDVTLVPCSTLDNVLGNRLDGENILIIVDIEGAENMMLEGATRLLDMNPKPIWLVEISQQEHQPKGRRINPQILETFEKFWDRGYESITADNFLRNISKEEVKKIIENRTDTLGTHNFLFYEKGRNIL
jgi:FkbM family methyltransferase